MSTIFFSDNSNKITHENVEKNNKKTVIIIALVSIFVLAVTAVLGAKAGGKPEADTQFLRIHIRANSNSDIDQSIKYRIKDTVVAALTPVIAECSSKEQAFSAIKNNLNNISKQASEFLKNNGFYYGAAARLTAEEFPARSYDGIVLESGVYDALIIDLGTGNGDNWWCVVYPPLCFVNANGTDSNGITYRSKIKEIIDKYFGK